MKQKKYFTLTNNLYQFNEWNKYGINVYFSTKHDGYSKGEYASNNLALHVGDENADVLKNRLTFAEQLQQPLSNFVYSNQTHSTNVTEVNIDNRGQGSTSITDAIDNCDGLFTFDHETVLNAFVADCTPVYFIEPNSGLIGVIHAGWQGTVKSIVYKAINDICHKHQINPENIQLLIGPSIEIDNFEVEKDVIELVEKMDYLDYHSCYQQLNDIKYNVNVKKLNYLQAIAAGIKKENIFVTDIDTFSNNNLFSYRQNNKTGRMCASIYRTNN